MSVIDWLVLVSSLAFIVLYGVWKTRTNKDLEGYLKNGNTENWLTIGLSVMATQASAITFLSTPGQAYESGMGFVQFYLGLPLAMIFISVFMLPVFYKLKVYTAYQYLEERFDTKVRAFTSFLFLLSRGLSTGITIYAPAIILSAVLGWNLQITCVAVGILVIIYTVSGGSKAVSLTQKWQMGIIMTGMFAAFYYVLQSFPDSVGFFKGVDIAGKMGKMQIIDYSLDIQNRYTLLSAFTGGVFLFISYFGTDQSQVQRYLGGKSLTESRLGLMFNGLVKIPMQFFILLIGVMVFVAFQFNEAPIVFNKTESQQNEKLREIESRYHSVYAQKKTALLQWTEDEKADFSTIKTLQNKQELLRKQYKQELQSVDKSYESQDSDYVFLTFILNYFPKGFIGLLLAVIFAAAMSSTAGGINALASTTTVDYYKKFFAKDDNEARDLKASKWLTVVWGFIAIGFSLMAGLFENLIQLVNILGSLFYGTILGIFLVAFFCKNVKANAVLIAGIIGQLSVLLLHWAAVSGIVSLSYLHYNIIGSSLVVITAIIFQFVFFNHQNKQL